MAKASYREAPEVKKIADELIEKYHRHLIDFDVRVDYAFVDKTPKSNGKEVWGTCRKISGINAYLSGAESDYFLITISEPVWEVLPHEKKVALVDHELCHAWAEPDQKDDAEEGEIASEEPVKKSLNPHDLEEFCCIVRRHGLWREDVEAFVKSALDSKKKTKDNSDSDE